VNRWTFKAYEYSWNDHGFSIANRLFRNQKPAGRKVHNGIQFYILHVCKHIHVLTIQHLSFSENARFYNISSFFVVQG
jgi:hypothetical protein